MKAIVTMGSRSWRSARTGCGSHTDFLFKGRGFVVLARGSIISPVVFNLLRKIAEKKKIPFTVQAAGLYTSTDADAIHIAREGVATALVSVPNRYMHSPNEMVSLADVDNVATLLAEACRAVTSETDFTAR